MLFRLIDCYRSNGWRVLLLDVALGAVVFTCIAIVRFLSVYSGDVERFQVAQAAQSSAVLTELRLQSSDLNKNIHDIAVQSEVVVGRLDRQITELRVLVNRSQKENQKAAAQEIKETRKVLSDSISNTADALQAAVDKAPAEQRPIQLVVPPLKTEIITPKAAPVAPIIIQSPPAAPSKQPGFWRRFWHRVFHWGG